jgi:HPt (histidine-containing phosphotransfer) domain-containing protein
MVTTDILDHDHLRHMTGGDRALEVEILELFTAQAQLWVRLLIPDAPVHTWRDAAHTLKGSARGLGLWGLAEACETAEAMAKSGVREGRLVAAQLGHVREALANALDAIEAILEAERASPSDHTAAKRPCVAAASGSY